MLRSPYIFQIVQGTMTPASPHAGAPAHIEGCGPGHNLLAYPSLACPACDVIAAHLEGGDGND